MGSTKRPRPPHRRSKTWDVKSPRLRQSQRDSIPDGAPPVAGGSFSHPKKDREAFRSALVNIIM